MSGEKTGFSSPPACGRLARVGVTCCLVVVLLAACSERSKTIGLIRENFDKHNYEETLVLCQHAIRKDIRDAEVYYYFGMALLELGRDYESVQRFEEAVRLDSTYAPRIGSRFFEKGSDSYDRGQKRRAAERLQYATEFDAALQLGPLQYVVADAFFDDKDFARAARFYNAAVTEYPDTAVVEQAYFNLADCHVALGDSSLAVEVLEKELERFPKGELAGRARWKLVNLLYEKAQVEFARGNYEVVVEQVTLLLDRTTNASLVQQARFLLGESYERMGDYHSAYDQYRAIIQEDRGASGRIVERARMKINAFRESGLI